MKYLKYLLLLSINFCFCQNEISVSTNTFNNQELIENILFGTNCVTNINFTSAISGNFSNGDLSYGYFQANNSSFPFQEGIVLSTGRLSNVPGPNNNLSDDDAPNWAGDVDLENSLNITNTINATVLEFNFVPLSNTINFRYLFASEEYREDNASTCNFSDAFAFLIRPVGGQYENLALVPGTTIPVLVTTVRPAILDACEAVNEEYFGQFNTIDSPTNFNGQTAILTAQTTVTPGQTYEVKLVIADETNYRYDSAVFIEANSFNVGVNLGQDLVFCSNQDVLLEVENTNFSSIRWFYEDQLINQSDASITINNTNFGSGNYRVEVDLNSGCTAVDDINITYDDILLPSTLEVNTCVTDDGIGVFNLTSIASVLDDSLQILNFFNSFSEAEDELNPINNPSTYQNNNIDEIVYVKVLNQNNCTAIAPVSLNGQNSNFTTVFISECVSDEEYSVSFLTEFIKLQIADAFMINSNEVKLFYSETNAILLQNEITETTINTDIDMLPAQIFARINDGNVCLGIAMAVLQTVESPSFSNENIQFVICENETITLDASLTNYEGNVSYLWNTNDTTSTILVTESGDYSVEITLSQFINNEEVICLITRNYSVEESSLPEVSFVLNGFLGNSTVQILAEGEGVYQYALNSSNYSNSNTFSVTTPDNVIRVIDVLGCGIVELNFSALRIPEFFTPNGDGINDFWQIEGATTKNTDIKSIYIFDRYGKLITNVNLSQAGWDGSYNGNLLPAQDYWYKIQLNSGKIYTGNITLVR